MNLYLLGPKYTFSDLLAKKLQLTFCKEKYLPSVSAIFKKILEEPNALALVPLENLLNGPVTSTLDGLKLLASTGTDYEIIHTENLNVDLYLGKPKDKKFDSSQAEEIYSHEQALSQSQSFLSNLNFNGAVIPVESTAAAVELALKSKKNALAISSMEALVQNGFEVISKTTLDSQNNQTRFALISSKQNKEQLINELIKPNVSYATSICLDPGMDRQGLLLEIINIISNSFECNLLSINSRPDQVGEYVFYFEIEGTINDKRVGSCIEALKDYCEKETLGSASLYIFGSYQRKEFIQNSLKEVTIIGADGSMGSWLSNFFQEKQVSVLEVTKKASSEIKEKIKESRYVFFSVPVQSLEEAIKEYLPYINSEALVIDNSSVKVSTVSLFKKYLPKNNSFVSIHTMFGPKETSLKGKNIIFIEDLKYSEAQNSLERFFYKHGALISKVSAEKHDQFVGVTQSLVHFISFSFSLFLKNQGLSVSDLGAFLTPNAARIIENVNRTLDQTLELSQVIQNDNPYANLLRKQLVEAFNEVDLKINNNELTELRSSLGKK